MLAARAVVSRDVPPYTVVAGNPAAEITRRFDDETVSRLLALAWWDWPQEKIRANMRALCSADFDRILEQEV